MKKHATAIFVAAACLCLGFLLGLSLGRQDRGGITVTATTRVSPALTEDYTLLVNINTASAEELTVLPGIGESYAQNIIDYREAHGPFETVEALLNVDGIGPARLEAILDYVTVGGTP